MIKKGHFLAVIAAFIIFAIYGALVFPLFESHSTDWPIFSTHYEGLSLVTYGKWWDHSFEYFLSDPLSGEFPVAYNFTSDYLLNVFSEILDVPSVVIHSVVYAPLILFIFVLLNYYYIYKLFEQPAVALISAILISYTADSVLLELFFGDSEPIKNLVHVPITSLHLATGQSLGWVLFIPTLSSIYLALQTEKLASKIIAGLFVGLLFQTHSLTFINAAAVIALFLYCQSLRENISSNRPYRAVLLVILLFFVTAFFIAEKVSAFDVIGYCAALSLLSLLFNLREWRFYVIVGFTSGLVVAPYCLVILSNIDYLNTYDSTQGRVVEWTTALVFYLPHVLLAVYSIATSVRLNRINLDSKVIWLVCFFVATLVLSQNHQFNWNNHPYRFTINLIFPLSIISAMALTYAWKKRHYLVVLLGFVVFGIMIQSQVQKIIQDGHFRYGKVVRAEEPLASYLNYVQENTAPNKYILLQAEDHYPRGVAFNSLVMSYSNSKAFLPDYRYVFWKNRYRNRLRTFCLIFPNFRLSETRKNRCESLLSEIGIGTATDLGITQDPVLKNAFIKALGIEIMSGRKQMAEAVRRQAKVFGWNIDFDNGDEVAATIIDFPSDDVGRITKMKYDKMGFKAEVYVEKSGWYALNILGAQASKVTNGVFVNKQSSNLLFSEQYFGKANLFLKKGHNQLLIPWASRYSENYQNYSDYISFISITSEQ